MNIRDLKPYKKNAKKHNKKQVPTVCLEELTEEQIKAYRLIDNKLNESEWNNDLLDEELGILAESIDMDMSMFGFDEAVDLTEDNETKVEVKDDTIKYFSDEQIIY